MDEKKRILKKRRNQNQLIIFKEHKKIQTSTKTINLKVFVFIFVFITILHILLSFIIDYTKFIKKFFFYYKDNNNIHYNIEDNINIDLKQGNNVKNFEDILPRINLKNETIPSLDEIFNSRILYIFNSYLSIDYIKYIRPINEQQEFKYKQKFSEEETFISPYNFELRKGQYKYVDFVKICNEELLLDSFKIEYNNKPDISIILSSYNKEDSLLKSIRSIQNQSFKNIEIIIVNDGSTDNSKNIFKYLLETDPRIRIFNHLKNMGLFKSRIDGILYSRGKYIILFDVDDLYEDNYVLEDAYNIMEQYNLDSSKFLFRIIKDFNKIEDSYHYFHVRNESKIIYGSENIKKFNNKIFKDWGNIWNRLTRANIYIKGLYILNDYILNLYKNMWDDTWFNTIINEVSFSFLIYERIGYVYIQNGTKEENPETISDIEKEKIINEYLGFLYFDYFMLPKNDNKSDIINKLKIYNRSNKINLKFLHSKFYVLYNLINILNEDSYISKDNKVFLNKILKDANKREKMMGVIKK